MSTAISIPQAPRRRFLIRADPGALASLALLYGFLVLYEFAHGLMLRDWFSPTFGYFYVFYDADRAQTYFWICTLTPLSLLPAGTRMTNASQFILPAFMAFVGLPTPLYLVHFVAPADFPYVFGCLLLCYFFLSTATRLQFRPISSPFGEVGYKRFLACTVLLFVTLFGYGMTQDFHLSSLKELYEYRYSNAVNGALIIRMGAIYVFSMGGFFCVLAMMFRKYHYAALALTGFVICYGLIYLKAALLAPAWLIFIYVGTRFFCRESTVRFYFLLGAPFLFGTAWYLWSPQTANPGGNLIQFLYMGGVMFRLYALTSDAMGFYYEFFKTHPHTYWSHISIVDLFVHYPYGENTMALQMQSNYGLGNYNASFLASDAIGAYGYLALPFVGLAVGLIFILFNTAGRGFGTTSRAVLTVMPALALQNIPLATTLLTNGIALLILYMAWMPRTWLARTRDI
jgi:hypothetical protein